MNVDEAYSQYAKTRKAAEEAERAATGSHWVKGDFTGFDTDIPKPVRFVGNIPIIGIPYQKGDAKILNVAEVKDDKGNRATITFPPRSDEPDHIMWRMIATVTKKKWDDNIKKFVNEYELSCPELWNKVVKGGFAPADAKYKFAKGWRGKEVLIANVIDRTKIDWHRANKKTLLTAKSVTEAPNKNKPDETITFVEEGIPTYPTLDAENGCITKMFSNYGNWNNYDILLTRHNTTQNSWEAANASSLKSIAYNLAKATIGHEPTDDEVTQLAQNDPTIAEACRPLSDLGKYIVTGPLTDEEKSWELTDIAELRPYTSYTSIKFKIGKTIAMIDSCLGTRYVEELDALIAKELATKAKAAPTETTAPTTSAPVSAPVSAPTSAPVTESARVFTRQPAPATGLTPEKITQIKYWSSLTPKEQSLITDVTTDANGKVNIVFASEAGALIACDPECGHVVPTSFTSCPYCGAVYA